MTEHPSARPQTTDHRPPLDLHCRGRWTVDRGLILVVFALLTGCAVLSPITARVPRLAPGSHPPEILQDGYHDFTGVIHIHTVYSDGAGTFEDIARVANQQRLDYLIVTDHNTLKPLRDGKQGWHGMTLILVGTEISTPGGHYLALNVREEINRHQPTQAIIDEVNRQGGLGFIAHPYFQKRRWTDWSVHGFVGIEGYNVAHDSLDENKLRIAMVGMVASSDYVFLSMVDRPYDPLATWDQLIRRHGQVVGIGASDAHEVRALGMKFAPYDIMFKLSRMHLLIPETAISEAAIYAALRQGHGYFSIDLLADASGFRLFIDDTRHVLGIMGDEVSFMPKLRLTAVMPARCELRLLKDGQILASATEHVWQMPITEPGVYRLEATLQGKPWIFSNPIYIRPAPVSSSSETPGPVELPPTPEASLPPPEPLAIPPVNGPGPQP